MSTPRSLWYNILLQLCNAAAASGIIMLLPVRLYVCMYALWYLILLLAIAATAVVYMLLLLHAVLHMNHFYS